MRPSPLTSAIRRPTGDDMAVPAMDSQPGTPSGPSATRTVASACAVDPALCEGCNGAHSLAACANALWSTADDPSG